MFFVYDATTAMQGMCIVTRSLESTDALSWPLYHSVARKIPFEDPQVLTIVRIAYVVVQAIVLGTYYFVSSKVSSRMFHQRGQFVNERYLCEIGQAEE